MNPNELHTSVDDLERSLLVLNAKYISLWSFSPKNREDADRWLSQLSEVGQEINATMCRLHELTQDERYKVEPLTKIKKTPNQ